MLGYGMRAGVRSRHQCRYIPDAGSKAEHFACGSTRSVVIPKLNIFVEFVPFPLPAPDGSAAHAATVSYRL